MADAIGIDVGSYKTVLGCVKQRGIEIVLSESSSKTTPSVTAFTPEERLIGDAGVNQMKRNFKNSCQFFQRFLGLNFDCKDQIEEEKKFITYKIVELENKKVGMELLCRGEKIVMTPEQVLASYLKRVKTYFENANMQSKEIVIAVPTYCSNTERQAWLDGAEIAGIKCIRLLNESTAICYNYGFFRKNDLQEKDARTVAFIDFGHSKLTVTFASFLKGKTKIIYTHSDRNMGARQIDYLLFDLFGGEFNKKYGCDPRPNARCRLRLLDSIEKMRKLLTSNKEADINCDSLMEDEDFHKHFKRTDLEELITPFLERFQQQVQQAYDKSGLKKVDFVELVGDSTRMPCIQEILKTIFSGMELSRTLNSIETVVRGCALQAAMLSPNFSVQNFEVQEYNPYDVQIQYKFHTPENAQMKQSEIFKVASSFPSTKTVKFDNKLGGVDLLVKYSDDAPVLEGLPRNIAQYKIQEGKLDESKQIKKYGFTMRLSNNIHNVCELESAELTQEWEEEEKIPVKMGPSNPPPKQEEKKEEKPAENANAGDKPEGAQPEANAAEGQADAAAAPEGEKKKEEPAPTVPEPPVEQQYEIKIKHKKNIIPIKFSTSSFAMTPNIKRQHATTEDKLFKEDMDILLLKSVKNDLEAYAYEMRDKCGSYGALEKYIDPEIKDGYLQKVGEVVDWLYGEGENAQLKDYQDRLQGFKEVGDQVKARAWYYQEVNQPLESYDPVCKDIIKRTGDIAHLTDEQKETLGKKIESCNEHIEKIKADIAGKKTWENPGYNLEQVQSYISLLQSECNSILNTPPPKKEEKKEEQAPAEEGAKAENATAEQPTENGGEQQAPPEGGEKADVEMTDTQQQQ